MQAGRDTEWTKNHLEEALRIGGIENAREEREREERARERERRAQDLMALFN